MMTWLNTLLTKIILQEHVALRHWYDLVTFQKKYRILTPLSL